MARAAGAGGWGSQRGLPNRKPPRRGRREHVKGKKDTGKKKETLRPWLVDVAIDHLR
jgi:hypothetical protein